ncbi:helix-turn-helix domain-containing protein [uncultured Flavobacterium sp.]|uniref:helix-turn-helix domain-containing protein n=1 Tax=uncultured Flavobacterium sp. TaxID=165435 RepID=UPI0030ED0B77|tara:strand:+ start:12174 stop:12452 length:279 start_codon:yes stop_codon:yes gene_type:complete
MDLEIDFTELNHVENNIDSQKHFEENKERFSNQCKIVYEALLRGEKLTTTRALIEYGIGDLRRRIKDLKDQWNVPIKSEYVKGKFKEYYLTT